MINTMISIAIDAMGGDFGPDPIVNGVIDALKTKEFHAVLVGDIQKIKPLIPDNYKKFITFVESTEVFSMGESATNVLKRKDSSIFKAIELVKNGECKAVVSAGHSGATMSLATLRIGRLKSVARPAIATLMPTSIGKKTLVLDVGANVDCKAEHLFQFAVMGEAYSKQIMKIQNPKVGLLSNGEEDCKGNEVTKDAFLMMSKLDSFVGNVEGHQIFDGSVDVIICDGFVGNILLKTSEGVANAIKKIIKENVKKSPFALLGAVLMKGIFKNLKTQIDYDEYGGAPLLGVKECVIISHGKSSPKAVKNAIFQALKFAGSDINKTIEDELSHFAR
ncbi:putative glycerol-3-phosphate acyltransferase PlsX [Campylobacter hyointestinalis subsp. hyointestinalis]|uniref:Phosphate acyltransferase n=2 Tax=Campylobacter hyointestinalis TaxID=198 RepID=A0A0S4S8L2_CAMHY|nr:putative glycerol-3-phosphate acyltransferase PlsX [Campylobacter hyointestinalis subsp. hyointestinalis]